MRRIVITGLGAVSPLGANVRQSWNALVKSKSGIRSINSFDATFMQTRVAGEVCWTSEDNGWFDPTVAIDLKDVKRMARFCVYAMCAASEALDDASWHPNSEGARRRTGVVVGSGIGGIEKLEEATIAAAKGQRLSPFFIPSILVNMASGNISIKYGFTGPSSSIVTACASGSHAIGDAANVIRRNEADVMVSGGAEAAICAVCIKGFNALKAMATKYNDNPELASMPWDKKRDGFVMGEGAGVLILEEYNHAKKRGAKIYAELLGYGVSSDAYHITACHPDGDGARIAMQGAMKFAKISTLEIDYINAHGTSTIIGDISEIRAARSLFGDHIKNIPISSTKSSTGHLLGGAGALEAVFSIKVLETGIIPPTLNLHDIEDECSDLNLVPLIAQDKACNTVLSNSFGFGGSNASLIFRKI